MSAPLKVGDAVVHVERFNWGPPRRILDTTIARETATQWVDASGTRWRKSDRAKVPQYKPGPRFIMSVPEFEASQVKP